MRPAIRPFPGVKLRRVSRAEIELLSKSGHSGWLAGVRRAACELARGLGLGGAKLDLARVAAVSLEDLRREFPGRWRFAILADPTAERLGFLALDPVLCGRLQALLSGKGEAGRGWFAAGTGENGAVGWLLASALEVLCQQEDGQGWNGYRYCGLCDSAGSVGRICFQQERLVGTWLKVRAGWDEGFAVWLEPDSSVQRRPPYSVSPDDLEEWKALTDLKVSFGLRLGRAELSGEEIEQIRAGDVVLFDQIDPLGDVSLTAGACSINGRVEGDRFEISRFEYNTGGEVMETADIVTNHGANGFDASQLGGLPLELTVEAGRVELSVSQLAGLRAGDVLTMPAAVLGPVDLRAGGRLVARGELVDVEGKRGVRLCELALVRGVDDEGSL
ncbi:MAG TPA: type III secretion system cytoplasmic ring protein SctQ [Myxococcota bacterium]|nr:type III secretion system cytoplasmic ring protein SctQ [Myxococcota bacterium]